GVIGNDGHGYELKHALAQRGIQSELLVESTGVQTFTYTKIINAQTSAEDRPRIDFVNASALPDRDVRLVLDRLHAAFDQFDIVMIADQAESGCGGVVNEAVRTLIEELAGAYPDKTVLVDSRTHIAAFSRVIAKPNNIEAEQASRELFGQVDYHALREH